ncbi:MAG: response regulator transcription factor, partial [Trebonia sp.]
GYALPLSAALAVARGDAAAAPPPGTVGPEEKPLTRREKEIAYLVADDLGNREIAERLFLSKRTVDSHVEHIFTKLGFTSRTQLTAWVQSHRETPG